MTTDAPLDAFAFLRELESNARTIAASKSGDDRAGWIEDADEFARAIIAARTLERDLADTTADMLRIHNEKVDHFEARIAAERELASLRKANEQLFALGETMYAEQERLRAALAERQAAIDEIVACKDATDALSIRHGGEWYTASYANEAKAVTDRKEALWPVLRALATKDKEPQP